MSSSSNLKTLLPSELSVDNSDEYIPSDVVDGVHVHSLDNIYATRKLQEERRLFRSYGRWGE